MALHKEFYASMFAASATRHVASTTTTAATTAAPFAAHAKKEFDMTSFLKDLAAVRARCDAMRCDAMRDDDDDATREGGANGDGWIG